MQVPVNIYSEMTPNPSTMKFVANKYLLLTGESVDFTSGSEAKGFSPLAEELFKFPFVHGVFIASNFVTITKSDNIPWDFITMEIREFIKAWIADGKDILIQMPAPKATPEATEDSPKKEYAPSEYDDAIRDLLDEYVKPAVEMDGGAIQFKSYNDGVVNLMLQGSCSGCPSSMVTLKAGIEGMMKRMIPEVKEVVAEAE